MEEPPFVEPVEPGKAWSWGDRPWRPRISLREVDQRRVWALMQGSGMTEAACLRQLVQEAIQARTKAGERET